MRNPLYWLCKQTVTVYHKEPSGVTRTVYKRAFLDFQKVENVSRTGSKESSPFLLVIPADGLKQPVYNGDKVMMGEGPEISPEQWASFIPAKQPGLVVVTNVDPKYFAGKLMHWEAG